MPQPLDAKRLLETTRHLTDTGRSQARQLGTELASQGRLAGEQLSAAVDELVNRPGRERLEELRQVIRSEVHRQLQTLGKSIKKDLGKGQAVADRIEAAVNELRAERREQGDALREAVRDEMQHQLRTLGLATRDDLAALGDSIRDQLIALERAAGQQPPSSTTDDEPKDGTVTATEPDVMITTPWTP